MSRKPNHLDPPLRLTERQGQEVLKELDSILDSHQFRTSQRCRSLLRYVTEHTLAGDTESLKERTLGIEVFDRAPDYDTGQDPVVRATAAETRKKLAQYYQEQDPSASPRIELHSGSYVALFHFTNGHPSATPSKHRSKIGYVVVAALAVVALSIALAMSYHERTPLEKFWDPLLGTRGPILVSVGQPIAYNLRSFEAQDAIQGIGPPPPGFDAMKAIPKKDLVILPDRYVALGDATCVAHVVSVLEKYGKACKVRGEHTISFDDLRDTPAVLIGAFDNKWTLRMTGQVRFTFVKGAGPETDIVQDREHPDDQKWKLTGAWPYWDVANDYAIVTRVVDATTAHPVVIAAGITQYGTMAAGEFLSDPSYFSMVVNQLPAGWEKRNLQFVLYVPVVNRVPGRARILAVHVW